MTARRYSAPPVLEAVSEFRFVSRGTWDAAIPGLVYVELKEMFPKRVTAQRVQIAPSDKGPSVELNSVIQFRTSDDTAFVQVAPHYLSVHQLRPYPGWTAWAPHIQEALNVYVHTARPLGVQRVGLRYVNRILLPNGDPIEPAHYLNFYPHLGEELPQKMVAFHSAVMLPYSDGRDALRLQLRSAEPEREPELRLALELDLDYFLTQAETLSVPELPDWLSGAHAHVEDVFEACLTERSRVLFEVVQEG